MKKRITSLMLILVVAVSMTMGASAASYIPDDVTYQNLNGQQLAIKTYTLLPDQDPSDLYEDDFEYDGFLYSMSDIVKEEQRYQEENAHTEVVTVTTASKNLEDILAELKPTIEYDDGVSSGTLSLDHSTLKTEAAGYKRSSYTVTATKNYTGLDRNDSSYIDKTVEKNGRTLSLSNVTWSVESTALVGDELVPATYSAVATYSGPASSTVATGYITTAEYKGTVVSSGISSILYTVTYLGTKIEPTKAEPTFKGAVLVISIIGGTALLAALLFLGLTLRKNTTVYKATGKGNEYEKCGQLHLKAKNPELRIDRLKDIPEGVIAIEVDQAVAKKLFGQTIAIRCYDNTVEHTVGEVNGSYWFKVDIGSQEGESNYEEEPNMKLKRLLTLCCALSMTLGMVPFVSAADYSFKTSPDPVYYGSTNYEDLYDAGYNYGARNQIDYDIPEIQYGLSQKFLETSLNNPYLSSGIQYGLSGGSATTVYPESDFSNSSIISGGSLIEVPYQPSVTITDLKQKDGSIGKVSIDRVSLSCKVYEGATDSSMSKGAGHYTSSGIYTGNIGLFGHNRGSHAYFAKLKNVKIGDIVEYKTAIGTKTYQVTFVGSISYTDYSYLNEMGDNRITLITCIANQPSLRLCVQAVEIR